LNNDGNTTKPWRRCGAGLRCVWLTADQAARATGLRLVGPNCLGVLVPPSHFNASFATRMPGKGDLAVISQSGAIVAGMIEWAAQRAIGFSAVISVGESSAGCAAARNP
jgi:acyl-CoA synthetase (NDP forming)